MSQLLNFEKIILRSQKGSTEGSESSVLKKVPLVFYPHCRTITMLDSFLSNVTTEVTSSQLTRATHHRVLHFVIFLQINMASLVSQTFGIGLFPPIHPLFLPLPFFGCLLMF